VLGVAYKANVANTLDSPTLEIVEACAMGATVADHAPRSPLKLNHAVRHPSPGTLAPVEIRRSERLGQEHAMCADGEEAGRDGAAHQNCRERPGPPPRPVRQ
jgi:hypothetical protein